MKNIKIEESIWKELNLIKYQTGLDSLSTVIKQLLENGRKNIKAKQTKQLSYSKNESNAHTGN
jgi:predicted CopG family antitoxin